MFTPWRVNNCWQYGARAKFELECLLYRLTNTSIQNSKSLAKMLTLNAGSPDHSEEKSFKISNFTFAILPFSHQIALTKLPFWVLLESTSLDGTIRMRFKIVYSNPKNAKSRVCQSHTTHSSVLKTHIEKTKSKMCSRNNIFEQTHRYHDLRSNPHTWHTLKSTAFKGSQLDAFSL